MEFNENELDDLAFQGAINAAMKVLDRVALCSDDNRMEAHYTRKGVEMIITVEEKKPEETEKPDHLNLIRYQGIEESLVEAYGTGDPDAVWDIVERCFIDRESK
ncbi:MAG: hypothetical protein COB09_18970 [Thalassobium sp.]|nr:MAG: hypothetical protein COB09_18970 [Thalassobium sp.]